MGLSARLAAGPEDLAAVLALRAAGFAQDGGADPLDHAAALLMVEDAQGRLLACARVLGLPQGAGLAAGYAARFYDLDALARDPRPVVELGRLTLCPGPQGWQALRLLWAAVARMVLEQGAARLIGCASFPGVDWRAHAQPLALLARDHLGPVALRPGARGAVVDYPRLAGAVTDPQAAQGGLPPLLRFYLTMGAWVSDHAVQDHALDTLHVLTCLEVASVSPARAASLRRLAGL